jgi:hypothetical protein
MMQSFWGEGPGNEAQQHALAERLRGHTAGELAMLGVFVPTVPRGTPTGARCARLLMLVKGVAKEKNIDL